MLVIPTYYLLEVFVAGGFPAWLVSHSLIVIVLLLTVFSNSPAGKIIPCAIIQRAVTELRWFAASLSDRKENVWIRGNKRGWTILIIENGWSHQWLLFKILGLTIGTHQMVILKRCVVFSWIYSHDSYLNTTLLVAYSLLSVVWAWEHNPLNSNL